jgi:hypothetical protein
MAANREAALAANEQAWARKLARILDATYSAPASDAGRELAALAFREANAEFEKLERMIEEIYPQ